MSEVRSGEAAAEKGEQGLIVGEESALAALDQEQVGVPTGLVVSDPGVRLEA